MPFSLSKTFFFPFISTAHRGLQLPLSMKALFEVLADINFVQRKRLKSKKVLAVGWRHYGGSFVLLF
jgi:hypothetical protein